MGNLQGHGRLTERHWSRSDWNQLMNHTQFLGLLGEGNLETSECALCLSLGMMLKLTV